MEKNDSVTNAAYVKVKWGNTEFKYVFWSRLNEKKYNDFGQTKLDTSVASAKVIAGSNNFKPPRATKKQESSLGYEGSFCSHEKENALRKSGYSITKKIQKVYRPSDISRIYVAVVQQVPFAWIRTPFPDDVKLGDISVKQGDIDDMLIFGASFPRPPIIRKVVKSGRMFQTFAGTGALDDKGNLKKSLYQAGWTLVKPALHTKSDLQLTYRVI